MEKSSVLLPNKNQMKNEKCIEQRRNKFLKLICNYD